MNLDSDTGSCIEVVSSMLPTEASWVGNVANCMCFFTLKKKTKQLHHGKLMLLALAL